MAKKRVFSGIQPSGNLHIGNYFGAILTWVREQDEKDNIFCIVDEHAITVPQDPRKLRKQILDLAKMYLAAGIDPKKSSIFVQSSRPEHTELGWILNCFTYMGELNRMTQFKDKAGNKGETVTVGLFDYPALMAADILLYDTDEVPVGEDQKQHVELTRDLAERMNKKFGKLFTVPAYYTRKESTRIMSLQDPTKKMSKSDENENSRIEILDSPEVIRKKFAKAVTDSGNEIRYDRENKPGISNLLNILAVVTNTSIPELEKKYKGVSYGEFKKEVAEVVVTLLEPFQTRYNEISDAEVIKVLKEGAEKVAPRAQATLKRVRDAVGLGI
jgi:tryptophanyl-tRNA synthetase